MRSAPCTTILALCLALLGAGACDRAAPTPTAPQAPPVPEGFAPAYLENIAWTPAGPSMLLRDLEEPRYMTLSIGEAEARSLQLRKERRRFVRPLTHDLLDDMVERLGGQILRVQIDGLQKDIFTSTIFLAQGDRLHQIDARPSDAVALALGHRAPLYIKSQLFDQAGFSQKALDEHRQGLRATPFSPPGQPPQAPGAPSPL